MRDLNCIENKIVKSDQLLSFDAKVRVLTKVRLLEVEIDGDCVCAEPERKSIEKPVSQRPLHLVFLVDTSDSFNKLEMSDSSAGEIILQKFVANFLQSGQFKLRAHPTTVSVIQFSGMGSDEKYVPGSGGGIQGSSLSHYKTELGPVNFSKLSEVEAKDRISKLSDVDTIDGNGQIYLALQDISMKNFHSKLDSIVKDPKGDRVLVIVTDDEWDFNKLKLAPEIIEKFQGVNVNKRKEAIVKYAKSVYNEIHTCVVHDKDFPNMKKLKKIQDEFGENVYPLPRNEIQELQENGPAKALRSVLEKVKQKIHENFVLDFQKKK